MSKHIESPKAKSQPNAQLGAAFRKILNRPLSDAVDGERVTAQMNVTLFQHLWFQLAEISRQEGWSLETALEEVLSEGIEEWEMNKRRLENFRVSVRNGTVKIPATAAR